MYVRTEKSIVKKGIVAYGSYLPTYRLNRGELAAAHGVSAKGPARVVASFDEDSTTLAVEAARVALRNAPAQPESLYLASTSLVYADKTNATAVHAALAMTPEVFVADLGVSAKSAIAAIRTASITAGMALLSDVRVGRPGSKDETDGTDGAASFIFAGEDQEQFIIAELLSQSSITDEFLDRWRAPGEASSTQWEERFGLDQYGPLVKEASAQALAAAGVDQADHVVLVSPNSAIIKQAARLVSGKNSTVVPLAGYSGTADVGLALAKVLDEAGSGETILVISAADGADALLFRTTPLLPTHRQAVPVMRSFVTGSDISYPKYLSWRGIISPEMPRRPEPDRPAGPPSSRASKWKFSFQGSRCNDCDFVHLPPARVCKRCGSIDKMSAMPLAKGNGQGRVSTFTVDRLAFSPSPPVINAVVDFDDGGRYTVEVADAKPADVEVGTRVELVFRTLFTAGGVSDYFWKVRVLENSLTDPDMHTETSNERTSEPV